VLATLLALPVWFAVAFGFFVAVTHDGEDVILFAGRPSLGRIRRAFLTWRCCDSPDGARRPTLVPRRRGSFLGLSSYVVRERNACPNPRTPAKRRSRFEGRSAWCRRRCT
jgi:hypothetical protein